ncbi:unannotated protein [freshwater metagenome]|uniref:Unannotated protein n=1 Tax=freshwater metagenome TaxID=449393 RepID=A0A6J7S243_9ZZZZ
MTTSPPVTEPVPHTVNGSVSSPMIDTPSDRKALSVVAIGRTRAPSSPSNETSPVANAATGGTKRMTVPAKPT